MNNLNASILEGIAKDVQVTTTLSGIKITEFNLQSTRCVKRNNDETEELSEFPVQCFGDCFAKLAEKMSDKGVRVVGRLKQNRWTDSDGKAHSKIVVIAEHIEVKEVKG